MMIWSNLCEKMIPGGFTTRLVTIRRDKEKPYEVHKPYHWTWCETDGVYYRDDVDDVMVFDIPQNGRKELSLTLGCYRRRLVYIDK